MKRLETTLCLVLMCVLAFPLNAVAQSMDDFYKTQKSMEDAEKARLENEATRRRLEQQRLDASRRDDEIAKKQRDKEDAKSQRISELELRLEEQKKNFGDQSTLQKQLADSYQQQLAESKVREESLRREVDQLKSQLAKNNSKLRPSAEAKTSK